MRQFFWHLTVGLIALLIVVAASTVISSNTPRPERVITEPPTPTAAAVTPIAQVGHTMQVSGWEVTLLGLGPYEHFEQRKPATFPRGRHVVADMRIRNLQSAVAILTMNDFTLRTDDGRSFEPVAETASINGGFLVSQSVQPSQTTGIRVVFDINPGTRGLSLSALKTQFRLPDQ